MEIETRNRSRFVLPLVGVLLFLAPLSGLMVQHDLEATQTVGLQSRARRHQRTESQTQHQAAVRCAVKPEKLDRVFEKLAKLRPRGTAGERGTGIGLFVTKKLLERMGGTIVAKPREPAGMRFEVRLPVAAARTDRAAPSVSPPA